jgi:DNA repair exonuclease SbcCD nuclease subunit
MKIPILTDTHCGIRNSSEVFINYQSSFYQDIFFPYCKANNVTQIIHGGDYYDHRKYINYKALNSNRKTFLEPLRQMGINMDIIPGNHDVFYKNTNDLCALKELLGFYTGNVNILMNPLVQDYGGLKIAMLPWVNNENYAESMQFIKNCKASWIMGHLELDGFEMMKGITSQGGMSSTIFSRFEKVLTGHFHTKSTRGNINYLGSSMEFTWSDADDPKYFHVIDTETRELEMVRNPITLYTKIFYDDEETNYKEYDFAKLKNQFVKIIVVNKNDPFLFDKFVDAVNSIDIHELKIAEDFSEFIGDNVQDDNISFEDTTQLLNSYVDEIDTSLDKTKLKSMIHNIYIESVNKEIV